MKKLYLLVTTLLCASVLLAQPANDNCAGAIQLTPSATTSCSSPVTGTVAGATASSGAPTECTGNASDDLWYRFTATATSHAVRVAGSSDFDAVFALYAGSCGSLVLVDTCVDARSQGIMEESVYNSLVIGQQYFIRVYDFRNTAPSTPTFTICVMAAPSSKPGCTNNITPANGATNVPYLPAVNFSWNASPSATQYDIFLDGDYVTSTTNTSIALQNLSPNTTYTWYIKPVNAAGDAVGCEANATTFTTRGVPPVPSNNECSGAITLSAYGGAINATTINATASQGVISCTGPNSDYGTPDDDVWFKITAVQNGNATITVTGASTFDAVIQVFSGTCGSLSVVQNCADATGEGATETATLTGLTAGQTYYIRVYDWTGGPNSGDNFTIAVSGTALPVNYTQFTGRTEGNLNILSWQTVSESNNIGFEIERSADSKSFSSIGQVATKAENGNSSTLINYNFTDAKPLSGNNYYRLKQSDKDGKINYSDVVLLKSKIAGFRISSVYPNPSKAELNLIITSSKAERATVIITDLSGKAISQVNTQLIIGDNLQQLNIRSLTNGTYIIKVVSSSGNETGIQRFVKN